MDISRLHITVDSESLRLLRTGLKNTSKQYRSREGYQEMVDVIETFRAGIQEAVREASISDEPIQVDLVRADLS